MSDPRPRFPDVAIEIRKQEKIAADKAKAERMARAEELRKQREARVAERKKSARPVVRPVKRLITPCMHQQEEVGFLDCSCNGAKKVYRCGKLIRPDIDPPERGLCMSEFSIKAGVKIFAKEEDRKKKSEPIMIAKKGEIIVCGPPIPGKPYGCDCYEPIKQEAGK